MKKIISVLMLAVALISLSACSGSKADKVAEKIENGKQLSQEDYAVMIQYSGEAIDYAIDALKKQRDNGNPQEELKKIEEETYGQYPHMKLFNRTLSTVKKSELDEKNQDLLMKHAEKVQDLLKASFALNGKSPQPLDKTKIIKVKR